VNPALSEVVLREIRLPLREPFRISSGVCTERRILLLELVDDAGDRAWSECVAGESPYYSAETVDTAWLVLREWLVPSLLRRALPPPGAVFDVLDRHVRDHRMAKAALEMGVWALEAERRGVPLAGLLGGERGRVPVGISLGIQPEPAALAERAAAALEAGYRRIKLKVAPGADMEYVAAVRRALGPAAPLMVDANNAYRLGDAPHLARFDEYGLEMIEQPLEHDDVRRHAELQRLLRTPICLDESITSPDRAREMIELEAGRIINIKPGRVGGFVQSIAIHDICRGAGIPVWCGGMLESGVGRAYNVALASLPNFSMPGDLSPSARYWTQDIVEPEWTMDGEGYVAVPTGTGLGIEVDRKRVEKLTVRTERLG
jgi:o-succinylbenzoate synthase